jgi:predicted DNA binding CopG/RHH family protein
MKTKHNFDSEELEILEAFNNNGLKRSATEKEDIENAKQAALNTVNKFEEVLIELPVKDLQRLKKKALQTGISYQSLISALVHKYVDRINVGIVKE